ncbi:MAG: acetolactate decarboxylase [Acidobacteria bacterium]|nr:acetolactate decarboxylase [Acidobacteriota bacterium]
MTHSLIVRSLILVGTLLLSSCSAPQETPPPELVRFGGMHEAIGLGQHGGRVLLSDLTSRPHFYGVGALQGLHGEITIDGSRAVVTSYSASGSLEALSPENRQATMLVGQSIENWSTQTIAEPIGADALDATMKRLVEKSGFPAVGPLVFVIEGEFRDVRLHVINGACPVHARMQKLEIPEEARPFELETPTITGKLVGIYAQDAVGKLTHPATSVHAHLIFEDEATGLEVTGHLERFGVAAGAVVHLPKAGGE